MSVSSNQRNSVPTEPTREFLSFGLGTEQYAIDILKVQELRGYDAVTRIANAPAFIKGVVNLRGTIVPIVDLRIRFNLAAAEYNEFTVVIVLNIGKRVVGAVVDSVSDVVRLAESDIHPPPEFSSFDAKYLVGLATVGDGMLILLDIEKMLTSPEMALVEQAGT